MEITQKMLAPRPARRTLNGLLAALAMIGALQAPLYAESGDAPLDELSAEIIRTGHEGAAEAALARGAEQALALANAAMRVDIALDLGLRINRGIEATVADAEPRRR